jgi:hypothetical protein
MSPLTPHWPRHKTGNDFLLEESGPNPLQQQQQQQQQYKTRQDKTRQARRCDDYLFGRGQRCSQKLTFEQRGNTVKMRVFRM